MNLPETTSLPIARLIIGFLFNRLSQTEYNHLDEWIEAPGENLQVFEELTEGYAQYVVTTDDWIVETENLLDCWMIARQMENILTPNQKIILDNWINESEQNKAFYNQFASKDRLQQLMHWFRQWAAQNKESDGLN